MIDSIPSNSNQYNPCGFISEDQFYLTREFGTTVINLNEIKRIRLINSRDLRINFFTLMISLIAIYFTVFYFEFDIINKLLFLIMLQPGVFFSIFYKKHDYKLILITKNYQFMITNVNESSLQHAKDLIGKTNSIIRSNYNALQAC